MRKELIVLLVLFSSSIMWAGIPDGYYTNAQGKVGEDLKSSLHEIIKDHTELSYDAVWTALKYTDEDPDNTDNVILLYSGWSYPKTAKGGGSSDWNREHTWAKSKGDFGTSLGPGTDIHHLRPTDVTVNSARGSMRFDEGGTLYTDASRLGGGSGATECYKGSSNWEPADEVKGDVARMLFYMATCYEGTGTYDKVDLELGEDQSSSGVHGRLSTLLKWHVQDPVSAWEVRRNNRAYEKQGNRNPFIDHPEYVCPIWGEGECDTTYTPPVDTTYTPPVDAIDAIYSLNFDNGLDGCTAYQISGATNWEQMLYNDNTYLYINTYEQTAAESWILTPSANFDTLSNEVFSFEVSSYNADKTISDCGAGQFEVYYSTSHTGTSIDASQWTRLTSVDDVMLGSRWEFVEKTLDVSDIDGENVIFAFVHKSDASNGTTWEIDNVKLTSNTSSPVVEIETQEVLLYPNPVSSQLTFATAFNVVDLISLSGSVIARFSDIVAGESIDVSFMKSGVYFVKTTAGAKVSTTKLIKR